MKIDKIPEHIVKTTEKLVTKKLLLQFFLIGLIAGFLEYSVPANGAWLLLWLFWIIVVIFKKAGMAR